MISASTRKNVVIAATATVLGTLVGQAMAAQTWQNGGVDSNWQTLGNWAAAVPTNADTAILPAATVNNPISLNALAGVTQILTVNDNYTINSGGVGGVLTLGNGTATNISAASPTVGTGRIQVAAGKTLTVGNDVVLPSIGGVPTNGAVTYGLTIEPTGAAAAGLGDLTLAAQSKVNLGASQTGLTGKVVRMSNAVAQFSAVAALPGTIVARDGNRWEEGGFGAAPVTGPNLINAIQYTGAATPSLTIPTNFAGRGSGFTHFYVDAGQAAVVHLTGDFLQGQAANRNIGIVTSDTQLGGGRAKFVLDAGAAYSFNAALIASACDIDVLRAATGPATLDNSANQNKGLISGPRNAPDSYGQAKRTVHFFSAANGGVNNYYYSALSSEAAVVRTQAAAGTGTLIPDTSKSTALEVNIDTGATLTLDQNQSGGQLLQAYDDMYKTGGGTLDALTSRNASDSQVAVRGAGFTFFVQGGTLRFTERKSTANGGGYNQNSAANGFFDGGSDTPTANGVLHYSLSPSTTFSLLVNDIGRNRTLRNNLTINAGGSGASVGTIEVGLSPDATTTTYGRLVLGGTGATTWTGELQKTGAQELVLNTSTAIVRSWTTSSAKLNIAGGTVTVNATTASDPLAGVPVTQTSSTVLNINGAATVKSVNGSGTLNIINSGSLLTVATGNLTNSVIALNIEGGTVPTATLDIKDGKVAIDHSGVSALPTVVAQIKSARNGYDVNVVTNWDGKGIKSSSARADSVAAGFDLYSIGAIENSDLADPNIGRDTYTQFGSRTVDATSTLLRYTYAGDADLNGFVDGDDYALIDNAFNLLIPNFGWLSGDFNYDGNIDGDDYALIDSGFLFQGAPIPAAAVAVPEPATLGVLALGVVGLLGRRRRQA